MGAVAHGFRKSNPDAGADVNAHAIPQCLATRSDADCYGAPR